MKMVKEGKLEWCLMRMDLGLYNKDVDVFDAAGKRYVPREWFIAPLEIIEQAIHFLMSGEIVNYKYDPERQEIVGR